LQIALAVAQGATNREAAEQLFLSPKTANWLPLVDALRTFLLDPTPDLRKTIDQVWFTGTTPRRRLA
jgi:hypothetical protein